MENVEISLMHIVLMEGACSRPLQRQEYLLTLVECAEGEVGEELHVVFYMLIMGRGREKARKEKRREGRHCKPMFWYEGGDGRS